MEESFGGSVGKLRRRIRTPFRAVHTLFAASGARARVTSGGGREEGDINFCRNRRLYASLLRHPRFDGCSFVVRSLNAGAGKERSIFNLRLHAKREKRGNRQTMRFVTVRARTHTTANNNRRGTSLSLSLSCGRDNAWNSAGTRRAKKCCCMSLSDCSTNRKVYALW